LILQKYVCTAENLQSYSEKAGFPVNEHPERWMISDAAHMPHFMQVSMGLPCTS